MAQRTASRSAPSRRHSNATPISATTATAPRARRETRQPKALKGNATADGIQVGAVTAALERHTDQRDDSHASAGAARGETALCAVPYVP
ncbi:hypothetical protein [Streptomyces canus]|uniref:hypothetical protein n=1 Tax=Streptomyces canus TaxID=58343 RepID=UPI0033BE8B46